MSSVWGRSGLNDKERCELLWRLGFAGIDLPSREQQAMMPDYGLTPTLIGTGGTTLKDGLIRKEVHSKIIDGTHQAIDDAVKIKCPSVILFPGERRGMSREEGADHAVEVLKRIAPYAESKGVNICLEITNSKVAADQRTDQIFDRLDWGWNVCRATGSPRMKVLYDIYHVQISNGDVVRNLKDNLDLVCHIHAAGVPTRAEIDDTQELNFRYIARQIADMGYQGFVAHEWRPSAGRNPLVSLATCFEILVV